MRVKALVLSVTRPLVAHAEGQWQLLVLYPVKKFGKIYRAKKIVFSNELVAVHSWIEIGLL